MTHFTPELVQCVAHEIELKLDEIGIRDFDATLVATAALEASGIADLTEALDDQRFRLGSQITDLTEALTSIADGSSPNSRETACEALAKFEGNTMRHERTPAPSAEPRLLPIVKHGTAGPIYEAPKPGDAVYIGRDGALYVAPAKIGGNHD
jgi:hypothetical protein